MNTSHTGRQTRSGHGYAECKRDPEPSGARRIAQVVPISELKREIPANNREKARNLSATFAQAEEKSPTRAPHMRHPRK